MVASISERTSNSATFVHHQNLVRGALGNRRKRQFETDTTMSPDLIFRTRVRAALLQARAALNVEEFADFLEWYDRQRVAEFGSRREGDIGFDYLNGIIDGPAVPLWKEIAWIGARLIADADALANFRADANGLDALCIRGAYNQALTRLHTITQRHGESLWAVQLRLALEQRQGGLEAQKAYLEHVRSKYRQGILSYVAYNTSVRNEDRTSWRRFEAGIRTRSAKRKDRGLAEYLNYRLLNEWPTTVAGVANVLRHEQSHSIIDIYETFVALAQRVIGSADLRVFLPSVRATARALASVDDFRLRKIAGDTVGRSRTADAAAALASGRLTQALRAANSGKFSAADPWSCIYGAAALATAGKSPPLRPGLFSNLLVRFLSFQGSSTQDAYDLEKVCHNFDGLPVVRGVGTFAKAVYALSDVGAFRFEWVGLNSPLDGPEDESGIAVVLGCKQVVDERAQPIAHAINALLAGDFEASRAALRPVVYGAKSDWLQRLVDLVWLSCADRVGDFDEVVASVSRMGSRDTSLIQLMPLTAMLGNRRPQDYKPLLGTLAPLNVLNMLWKVADDDRAGSSLKLLTGQFLRSDPGLCPSLLVEREPAFDRHELIYFLREVCVPEVLDVSRLFTTSKAVLEERQAVCAVLHLLDPDHADQYSAEVAAITRRLKVDEGLKIVDQSRIHVDTEAVTRWARKNLSEEFERYVDLVNAGIGAAGSFDEALREVKEAVRSGKQADFFTPQNEADNSLVELLQALREEFLNSSTYGLDYFLSKRIRHVSFVGLVRSPLEFSHLIANKATAQSDYSPNSYWREKLSTLDNEDGLRVDHAIKRFSKLFDDAVNRLKGELLHVRSSERSQGIFDVPLSMTVITLSRALLVETVSFEEFLNSVYVIFWAVLESSLAQARRIIDDQLKMQIAHAMDNLKLKSDNMALPTQVSPNLTRRWRRPAPRCKHPLVRLLVGSAVLRSGRSCIILLLKRHSMLLSNLH